MAHTHDCPCCHQPVPCSSCHQLPLDLSPAGAPLERLYRELVTVLSEEPRPAEGDDAEVDLLATLLLRAVQRANWRPAEAAA